MNSKNIQEYVADRVIIYLQKKDEEIKQLKNMIDKLMKNRSLELCSHCKCEIIISDQHFSQLYEKNVFRRCSGHRYSTCTFIICGNCAGDFYDDPTQDPIYDKIYNWTGNSWLGVHPRPIEDDDYICCNDCPMLKK